MNKSLHKQQVKEITKDLANTIVRGEAMVPICSVGPLLKYISDLEMEIKEQRLEDSYVCDCGVNYGGRCKHPSKYRTTGCDGSDE